MRMIIYTSEMDNSEKEFHLFVGFDNASFGADGLAVVQVQHGTLLSNLMQAMARVSETVTVF